MGTKRPLCNYDGTVKELATADLLPPATGLFEIDIYGGLMPITEGGTDINYELDGNGDIQPI